MLASENSCREVAIFPRWTTTAEEGKGIDITLEAVSLGRLRRFPIEHSKTFAGIGAREVGKTFDAML